jgi:hypothetical protein
MFRVTVTKTDNARRGNVNRSVEFENECHVSDMIGAIDGLLRQCFPDDMRHRGLNLSRDTTTPRTESAVQAPDTRGLGTISDVWADEDSAPVAYSSSLRHSDIGIDDQLTRANRPISVRAAPDIVHSRGYLPYTNSLQERAYINGFTTLPTASAYTEEGN